MAQINQLSVTSGSVSLPNSGSVAIFSNIEDNGNLYIKTSTGTVTPVGNTSGGDDEIVTITQEDIDDAQGSAKIWQYKIDNHLFGRGDRVMDVEKIS